MTIKPSEASVLNPPFQTPIRRESEIKFRVFEYEKQAIKDHADKCNLNVSDFIRAAIFGHIGTTSRPKIKRVSHQQGRYIALIIASLGRMMECVKDISNSSDTAHHGLEQTDSLKALTRDIRNARDMAVKALGKKP